jgi:hypothetical protein
MPAKRISPRLVLAPKTMEAGAAAKLLHHEFRAATRAVAAGLFQAAGIADNRTRHLAARGMSFREALEQLDVRNSGRIFP